jgi:hypothetical protein
MEPQITPNTFCTYTALPKDATTTVFFISGNPGLIGYYHPFLSLLGEYLANTRDQSSTQDRLKKTDSSIQIFGYSLGGFEVDCENVSPAPTTGNASRDGRPKLYDLEDQIVFVHDKLNALMRQNASSANDTSASSARRKVILMGHSVGAYIAMEVLRRHREANPESQPDNRYEVDFDIIGGVMLFPTVKDIAHSPSGQKLTVRLLLFPVNGVILTILTAHQTLLSLIPHLALVVSFFARILTTILPTPALRALVKSVMHNPPAHALDATTSFLKSAGGVRQAL